MGEGNGEGGASVEPPLLPPTKTDASAASGGKGEADAVAEPVGGSPWDQVEDKRTSSV